MLLVRRNDKYRLMSFKSNPWLEFNEEPSGTDEDVIKQSFFLFSGAVKFQQTETYDGEPAEHSLSDYRRFNNDKVQNVQLITQSPSGVEQYMLII